VSDIVDENLLDVDAAKVPNNSTETPNTFGRNLLRRLGIPHGHTEAEAAACQLQAKLTKTKTKKQQCHEKFLVHRMPKTAYRG